MVTDEIHQETAPMQAPVYEVDVPGVGPLWFEDYTLAYQNATGCQIGDDRADPADEERITLTDFEGSVEVPIANV